MKLLVVSRGVKPVSPSLIGGAEHVMWRLAEEAARRGHEVHVVTDAVSGGGLHPGIKVHRVGIPAWIGARLRKSGFLPWIMLHLVGNILAFRKAQSLLRSAREPFDAIHCHGNLSAWLLSHFKHSTPLIYTEHDSTPWSCSYPNRLQRTVRKFLYTLINARTFRRADVTVVLYEDHRREIVRRWRVPAVRIEVAPNGVDVVEFSPASARTASESRPTSIPAGGYCLFVGRLESRKGVDLLLKAISKAPKSPDCVIVGDGPARKKLEALSRSLRLDRRVRFAGEVKHSDLARYYRGARFFALPSLAEAFPLTALEAMACGTPIVASEVGAAGSLIHSTSCGLSFRPGDVDDLAAKITAVSSSLESARQMGANGRRSALERYSWTRVGSQMTALYAAAQTVGRSAAATASGPVEHEA